MFHHRHKLTKAEKQANSEAKAKREAAPMTCQCCGRAILANTGKIAHHGYERPYEGWQTASCMGARELPFEVDRVALGRMIVALEKRKDQMIEARNAVANETMGVTLIHSFLDYYLAFKSFGYKPVERTIKFEVTRENWDSVINAEDNREIFENKHGRWESFDVVKKADLTSRDHMIKMIEDDITFQTKRYNNWTQTHRWNGTEWEKL